MWISPLVHQKIWRQGDKKLEKGPPFPLSPSERLLVMSNSTMGCTRRYPRQGAAGLPPEAEWEPEIPHERASRSAGQQNHRHVLAVVASHVPAAMLSLPPLCDLVSRRPSNDGG